MAALLFSSLFFLISVQLRLGDFVGFQISAEAVAICCFSTLQTVGGFHNVTKGTSHLSPGWLVNLHLHEDLIPGWLVNLHLREDFIPGWCLNPPLHEKFHKSQQDSSPSRWVNLGLEKGYPVRRVDPGWLLQSCKYLLRIYRRRADPLRWVETNPGSCKGASDKTLVLKNRIQIELII